MRLSIELKPTVAPCSWSAFAIPQAIEWSFATPKTSAFLPSSSPIRSLHPAPVPCRNRSLSAQRAPAPDAAALPSAP